MKIFIFLAVIFVCLIASCAQRKADTEPLNLQIQAQNSKVVLDIQQDAVGMWAVTGKSLFFRLYENGIIELDFVDESKITIENRNKIDEVKTLQQAHISEEDFKKFQTLFDSEKFKKDIQIVKKGYRRECCCTDASLTYKIDFQFNGAQKIIDLNGYCSLSELTNRETRNSADIPITLSELMRLAYLTRLKYLSKE